MHLKKQVSLVVVIFNLVISFSQNKLKESAFEHTLKTASIDSIESHIIKHYSVQDYTNALNIAVSMSNTYNNDYHKQKGANLLALLAKNFANKVIHKKVNLDDERVKDLLSSFEKEKYFIEKPKTSRFIKFTNYLCKGEYAYLHDKLISTTIYRAILFVASLFLFAFFLSYSSKFKWKHEKRFRKISLFSLATIVFLFILFKSTCYNNIKDYSFYGISI